jgi:hypothetical protein
MKIEMGESLFYSWLRHVKECQVVQTNWKPSPSWQLQHEDCVVRLMDITDKHFQDKYGYALFGKNSLSQLLMQAEVDAFGVAMTDVGICVYAIDVAFHEAGLNYGDRPTTVTRVIKKLIRTALCIKGYFNMDCGEVIFASPKINNAVMDDLEPCIAELNELFKENGYEFNARIIANDNFNDHILKPILIASDGVSDTSELFMRGFQLVKMFGGDKPITRRRSTKTINAIDGEAFNTDSLAELKIGKIAQTLLRNTLASGSVSHEEIELLRTREYSKDTFGIDYPVLALATDEFDKARYYSKPFSVRGLDYFLCSQWFEVPANNDRPFLITWLEKYGAIQDSE